MKKLGGSKWLLLVLLITVLATVFFIYNSQVGVTNDNTNQPYAQSGYLDLSNWDFENNGNIKLDGQWEFYWGKLLIPENFVRANANTSLDPDGYINVPSAWNGMIGDAQLFDKGVATYRLKVRLGSDHTMYGIKINSIRMSDKVFVDGLEIGKSGNPAMSHQDGYVMANTPYVTFFYPQSNEVEVIIQVANFDYKSGGIVQSIYLGQQADILMMAARLNFFSVFVAACLVITGLYYLLIYFGRQKDVSLLYYSVYSFMFSFVVLNDGEKVFMQMFPHVPYAWVLELKYLCLYTGVICITLFVKKITVELIPDWFVRTVVIVLAGSMMLSLVLPLYAYSIVENLFLLFGIMVYATIDMFLILGLIRKQYGRLERFGIQYSIVAFSCVLVYFAHGVLFVNNFKSDAYIGYIALLLFVTTTSSMLSRQYTMAYDSVERMSLKLLELDKLKDEFLANTSHELRTPLNGIINLTKLVLDDANGNLSEIQQQDLTIVVGSARRMNNLINDILDISSLNKGVIRLSPRPVNVHSVAEAILYVFKHLEGEKEIAFINSVRADVPPVYADVERLRQVFYNLIGNAFKFTAEGRIEVGAVRKTTMVEIWVEDTGCGIPKDKLDDSFKPFCQGNATEIREYGGTGLGLSITKKLIELHGGSINIASTEGIGTRLTFTLPICEEPQEEIHFENVLSAFPEVSAAFVLTSSSTDQSQKYSILVADDDLASLTAIFNILNNEGFYVKAVGNGAEVLAELDRQSGYNLIILDIMMPKMSGYEVLKRIRQRFQPMDLPVLLLTAKARPEDLQAGFAAGANDYISKPFEALELKARVRTLVQLKESVDSRLSTELSFLQAQIKPHFLYNSLSVIAAFSTREPLRAKELLYDLADYLRGSFDFENYNGITSLAGELTTIRAYLSIEKERFCDKLQVEYDIEEGIEISIPMLSIQPLIENALRHGILRKPGGGTVKLSVKTIEDQVVIEVQDDGVGMPDGRLQEILAQSSHSTGVGLKNIQRRLILHYGRGLDIRSTEGRGTTVTMKIPRLTGGLRRNDADNLGR